VTPVDHPTLGTLDWRPATERSALLAPPVAAAVRALDLPCFVAPIDPDLADTAAFCRAYDVGLDVSANCVVVAGRRGETTTTAACLVLASDRADVNKVVRKRLDVRKISFASMDDAVQQTGMEYGGITPVGLPAGWPVLVDEAVARTAWVVIGSGVRGSKIALPGAAVSALPGAETLALAVSAAG
jgi:prolyl-tRNA editing enzyme YbaK/EbsC (Cys-tRNA(Pro) deacylase)